jgi:DNA-binding SARP family transcriptional activator
VTLFGGFHARSDPGRDLSLPSRKAQALLAYLALRPGQAHPRDKLAALLWGESTDALARDSLRHALAALRDVLPDSAPPILLASGHTLALNPVAVAVDVADFERGLAEGTPDALEQAAALYAGDLLAGVSLDEPLFEDWLLAERERLRELALEALAKLLAHQHQSRASERAIRTAIRLLALDPLQEAVHRTLMRLYVQLGRRGAALHQYQLCVSVLHRELGMEPEEDTRRLYQDILRGRTAREVTAKPEPRSNDISARSVNRGPSFTPARDIPLIGRDSEMARLRAMLTDVADGVGRAVACVGEAGVGKSRLAAELAATVDEVNGRVLVGRCHESEQILPFGPWIEILRGALELTHPTQPDLFPPAIRREMARLLPELAVDDGKAAAPPEYLKLFEGVTLLLAHIAAQHAVLVVLEDLHWADEMTVRLAAFIARRLARWRLLLLLTARTEELADAPAFRRTLPELDRESLVDTIALRSLSRRDTEDLVRVLSRPEANAAAADRLSEHVWRASEGNPFVVIEAMRVVTLEGLAPGLERLSVPDRVRALVGRQLDRLGERSRELATLASVVGRDFDFALLQQVSGGDEEETAREVEELSRRHVLHTVGEYLDFTHDRVREVIYGRILPARRKGLHRRVAEALATLHAEDLEPHQLALGLHYAEGEVWDKAVLHLRAAGARAVERSANREALACLERAIGLLAHLPDTRMWLQTAVDLQLELRTPLHALGQVQRGFECSREAQQLAVKLSDRGRLARASVYRCHYSRQFGRLAEAVAYGRSALAIADEVDDARLAVSAAFSLGLAHSYLGEYSAAEELFRRTIDAVEANRLHADRCELDGLPAVTAPAHLARVLAERGAFEEGVTLGTKALTAGEKLGYQYSLVTACWALGWLCNVRGEFGQAVTVIERARSILRRWELPVWLPLVLEQLGFAYAVSGRLDEGIRLLEESFDGYRAQGRRPLTTYLGEVYLLADRLDDATVFAEEALALAQQGGERRMEAFALALLGKVAARREPVSSPASAACYQAAMSLAEALGMRPLLAHCHAGLGQLYRRHGSREQAQEHVATGAAMYRDLGMRFWLEKLEAETRP